jgi:hypothetical protein
MLAQNRVNGNHGPEPPSPRVLIAPNVRSRPANPAWPRNISPY